MFVLVAAVVGDIAENNDYVRDRFVLQNCFDQS